MISRISRNLKILGVGTKLQCLDAHSEMREHRSEMKASDKRSNGNGVLLPRIYFTKVHILNDWSLVSS